MKKLLFIFVLCFLIFSSMTSFAQIDINKAITDENQFSVLATISDIDNDYVYAELYDVVGDDGEQNKSSQMLKLNKFRYTYCETHANEYNSPKIGDNIYVCLYENSDGSYFAGNVAYKTDSVDLRTLNVYVPFKMKDNVCMADVAAISYFIRSDGGERNITVSDGEVFVEQDGKKSRLYPSETEKALPVIYIDKDGQLINDEKKQQDVINVIDNPIDQAKELYNTELLFAKRIIALSIISIGCILGVVFIYLNSNKKKNRGV